MKSWPENVESGDLAALNECLDYLYTVMVYAGLTFPAHLVGTAALAIADLREEDNRGEERRSPDNVLWLDDIKRREPSC